MNRFYWFQVSLQSIFVILLRASRVVIIAGGKERIDKLFCGNTKIFTRFNFKKVSSA